MPRISTFCPRCGETIESEIPDEAKLAGRAELDCPACRFAFVVEPAARRGEVGTGRGTAPPTPAPAMGRASGRPEAPADPASGPPPVPPIAPTPSAPPSSPTSSVPGQGWRGTDTRVVPPSPGAGARRVTARPLAAGVMLLFVGVVGSFLGSVLVVDPGFAFEDLGSLGSGTGDFTGRVIGADGAALVDVAVTLVRAPEGVTPGAFATRSDANGTYRLGPLDPGVYVFLFQTPGHRSIRYEAPVFPPDSPLADYSSAVLGEVRMAAGDPADVEERSIVRTMEHFNLGFGVVVLMGTALAFAGGVACFMRRFFALAVVGSVGGIFTFGWIIGSALSVFALVLIILARREFRDRRTA